MSMYLISMKYGHAYLTMDKKGTLGTQDEKRPRNFCDVDDGILIPWLKMD